MGRLFDLLFPPRCALCRKGLDHSGMLCPDCARAVADSYRPQQGKPVQGCDDSAAALVYRDQVRRMLISCKYGDRPALGAWGGSMTADCLAQHLSDWNPDLVTYTPTTLGHWWKRGFNLAQVLARRAAQQAGLPCVRTLRRDWFGRSQLKMHGADERRSNAQKTYRPARHVDLTGKRVVLVDDILATGATASICAAALRQMGASAVFFLCLAQTPSSAKSDEK